MGTTREITTAGGRYGLRMTRWLGRPDGDLREGGEVTLWMGGPDESKPEGTDDVAHLHGAGWEDFLARLEASLAGRPTDFLSIEPTIDPLWATAGDQAYPAELPVVTSTGETSTLEAERWVAAPSDVVWDRLSTRSGLEQWYVNAVSGHLVVGGRFRCVFDQGEATGEVLTCTPERELAVTWQWAGVSSSSRMTVTLTPETRDGLPGTRVRWREDDATGDVEAYAAGLHSHLVGLDRASRGLPSAPSRWYADFVSAFSQRNGSYANPFGSPRVS